MAKVKRGLSMVVFLSLIPCLAIAQSYLKDDFSKGSSKWVDVWGNWSVKDGAYYQGLRDDNCMAIASDEFWKEEWEEYTFQVKAKKLSGGEGFLIMFRLHGTLEPRGRALRELPASMKNQSPRTQYWWNLGGWANVRSCVERWINSVRIEQANTNHIIKVNEWYEIKIDNRLDGYTLYLNDEKIANVEDAEVQGGRVGLATWQTEALFDDVVVYGPSGLAVSASGRLPIKWGLIKSVY